MKHIGQHAIVVGASMGGLLAARALSDFYAVVTVLERDGFPQSDIARKGVPQGRHAHGLLARGRNVIESFFPGWTDEVVASGGVRGDIAGDDDRKLAVEIGRTAAIEARGVADPDLDPLFFGLGETKTLEPGRARRAAAGCIDHEVGRHARRRYRSWRARP